MFFRTYSSTDEDARQAFEKNQCPLKGIQIKLALSSRTEMQKVIEEARTKPFLQSVNTPVLGTNLTSNLSPVNKIPTAPQAPHISSSTPHRVGHGSPKRDDKDIRNRERDDSSRDDDSKGRRERSRRRTRSRSRSRERKDRSRDRRDRRRRDRSRSRDRRDKRRDSRKRSKSRERTRSKDRDTRRSKEGNRSRPDLKPTEIIEIKDDPVPPQLWDSNNSRDNSPNYSAPQGLLGNFPGSNMDDPRRSVGTTAGVCDNSNNNGPAGGLMNNRFQQRNDDSQSGGRDWPPKGRFHDRNNQGPSGIVGPRGPGLDNGNMSMLNQGSGNFMNRPDMNMMGNMRPNMFQNQQQNMRTSFGQDSNFGGGNRSFLSRPGTLFSSDKFRHQGRGNAPFGINDRSDDFRKDRNNTRNSHSVMVRPYFGGYGEIRKFFGGLFISSTGVKFLLDENRKKTGIVYVRFVRPDGKEQALQRSGLMLRGCPIEVKHIDDELWDNYNEDDPQPVNMDLGNSPDSQQDRDSPSQSSTPQEDLGFPCAVVEDLPEFVTEHDIRQMFRDYSITYVHMIVSKFRHLAYVQFDSEEECNTALSVKTSHVISGKPVTVKSISMDVFNEVHRKQASKGDLDSNNIFESKAADSPHDPEQFLPKGPGAKNPSKNVPSSECVLLNGLPPKTTDRDVLDFFSDIGIVPSKIHIMHSNYGSTTGEAYCEFSNTAEVSLALDKNDMPLGTGTVLVEAVHRRDMERSLGIPSIPSLNSVNMMQFGGMGGPGGMSGPIGMSGHAGMGGPGGMMSALGGMSGLGNMGGPGSMSGMGGSIGMVGPGGPRFPNRFISRGFGNMGLRGRGRGGRMGGPSRFDSAPVDVTGPSGCVVALENVPFKAHVDEILDLFIDFEVEQDNVLRRFNEQGVPTGSARVTFNSPEEARRAVNECNRRKIRDRSVFLHVLQLV